MTFKIEKGVPVPPRKGAIGESLYPFADMSPGDSFVVQATKERPSAKLRSRLTGAACAWAKRRAPGSRFATRVEPDGNVRIWMLSRPASLAPTARPSAPPPAAIGKVHRLADGEDEKERTAFAHPIPSFTNGGKPMQRETDAAAKPARVVKGSRY